MNDFEGFETPELSDQDMQRLEPLSLGDSKAENPGLVKGPFNQYVPADKMVGGVTAREYYGGNQSSRRQTQAEIDEKRMGVLKPISQFMNSIMSPGFGEGIVTGPINAVSRLGNAIGDAVQGKEVDVSDAWQITPEAAAAANPIRAISGDTDITPQDVGGREWGGILAGELAGVATGSTIINKLSKVPALVRLGQAALQTRNARRLAVAARTNRRVRTAVNFGRFGGEALFDTSMSTVFQDPLGGNSANLGDLVGLNLPGRVEEGDNYLEAFGKSMLVDGVLLPLQLIGVGALIPRVRRFAADGDLPQFVTDLADAELAPYTPSSQPLLPPSQAGGALAIAEPGGALAPITQNQPFDSAISRSTSDQLQIQQVESQRQRLAEMGLQVRRDSGQYELTFPGSVDPEVKLQVRALQVERGRLIAMSEEGMNVAEQIGEVDRAITNLISGGTEGQMPPLQMEIPFQDAPDPRPELGTFLAELDELDDAQIRSILRRVDRDEQLARRQGDLEAAQQQVDDVSARMAEIEERAALPEGVKRRLTPVGAKRQMNKLQKEMDAAQLELQRLNQEPSEPVLVGNQLTLAMDQQTAFDLYPIQEMPEFQDMYWDEASQMFRAQRTNSGYKTAEAYREALLAFPRDLLRKMAAPNSAATPEAAGQLAALVKARTGRRVWSAKKEDLINAFVEYAQRQNKFLPPVGEQMELQYRQLPLGDGTTLDMAADLETTPLRTTMDADGNPVIEPAVEYTNGRGMDPALREEYKRRILQAAIDNGEVQPDVTPIPSKLPIPEFNQGTLIDELMADETGQLPLLYATDVIPTYKAGSKSVEALLEETRLRYDWALLDNASKKAGKESYLKSKGWDTMTWEQKKQAGILEPSLYFVPTRERTYTGQPLALAPDTIGTVDPNAAIAPPRKPKVYRWTPEGVVDEAAPAAAAPTPEAPTPEAPAAKPRTRRKGPKEPSEARAEENLRKERIAIERKQKVLAKSKRDAEQRLAKLRKQQEVNCNG